MSEQIHKILLADDDQDILMLVSFYLQKAGLQPIIAENGLEALEKARKNKPHLAILDRMMPGMDGIEVCKTLRAEQPNVYIIMLTAMASDQNRIEGLEAGADDYIIKPFNATELVLRVQAFLRRSRVTSPSEAATVKDNSKSSSVQPNPEAASPVNSGKNQANESVVKQMVGAASQAAKIQDTSRAREIYLQVLKLEPANESALMWLAWNTSDPYEGCTYLERLVAAHPENVRLKEYLEAGRRRCQELDQLITDSSVLGYWSVVSKVHEDRIRKGIDRRSGPVQKVGELLLKKGFITRDQLDTAVTLSETLNRLGTPKKLGEVLLEYGYLNPEQLQQALNEQKAEFESQFY